MSITTSRLPWFGLKLLAPDFFRTCKCYRVRFLSHDKVLQLLGVFFFLFLVGKFGSIYSRSRLFLKSDLSVWFQAKTLPLPSRHPGHIYKKTQQRPVKLSPAKHSAQPSVPERSRTCWDDSDFLNIITKHRSWVMVEPKVPFIGLPANEKFNKLNFKSSNQQVLKFFSEKGFFVLADTLSHTSKRASRHNVNLFKACKAWSKALLSDLCSCSSLSQSSWLSSVTNMAHSWNCARSILISVLQLLSKLLLFSLSKRNQSRIKPKRMTPTRPQG